MAKAHVGRPAAAMRSNPTQTLCPHWRSVSTNHREAETVFRCVGEERMQRTMSVFPVKASPDLCWSKQTVCLKSHIRKTESERTESGQIKMNYFVLLHQF